MRPLPEIRSWQDGIGSDAIPVTEARVRWLRSQISTADGAIAAQNRIIAHDGALEGYVISLDSLRNSQHKMESELAGLMRQRNYEVLDFALDGKRYAEHRASAKALSVFLDAMQRLYERIGQALSVPNPSPRIPEHIRQMCQLDVAGFFPSSFGIRFAQPTRADLVGNSLTASALEATFDLVNSQNPVEQAARLGQRSMHQYKHLITTLISAEATPKVSWHDAAGEHRQWISDDHDLRVLANRLASIRDMAPKTVETTGFLTGASLRRHKFEFDGGEGIITGKAPAELAAKVTENFGRPCTITYVETLFIDETTDQEKRSRTLVDIRHA